MGAIIGGLFAIALLIVLATTIPWWGVVALAIGVAIGCVRVWGGEL